MPPRRSLRLNPQLRELEGLITDFRRLNISADSEFLAPVTLERAWHVQNLSPTSAPSEGPQSVHHLSWLLDSPEPRPSIAGSLDSPFIPGGVTHSMPPQDSLPFLPDSPGLSSLSPLTPLQSPSFPFTLEFPVFASVQSDHTSSPSLAFLFNQSVYLVEPDFDPPSLSVPLAPEASGASLLSPSLPVPVSLLLPAPVRPEATSLLPSPLAIPALAPVSLPVLAVNLVNLIQPPANPQQNLPIPMAQVPFQMPL